MYCNMTPLKWDTYVLLPVPVTNCVSIIDGLESQKSETLVHVL